MTYSCLLCGNQNTEVIESWDSKLVIEGWKRQFNIDVSQYFREVPVVKLLQCPSCQLKFFPPELAGGGDLYAQLQNFDWYYLSTKWEHDATLEFCVPGFRLLEVGCGNGHFLDRLSHLNVNALGIELNDEAVKVAQSMGRNVIKKDLSALALEEKQAYDIVCSFQVLEHVTDPRSFLESSIELLKPNGKLIIAVPNNKSFISLDRFNLLNLPPHHITKWTPNSLNNVSNYLPVEIIDMKYEPLSEIHFQWYFYLKVSSLFKSNRLSRFVSRLLTPFMNLILLRTGIYKSIKGHSILTVLSKSSN